MGDLVLSDDVLRQTAATFKVLADEAGLVNPVSLDGAGSPAVADACGRAEQWYRGAAGLFSAWLAQSGWQAAEVAETFGATDQGIAERTSP